MVRVVGLDLSLTATGISSSAGPLTIRTTVPIGASERTQTKRLLALRRRIGDAVELEQPDLVVLEGYGFAAQHSRAHALGELGGVIRVGLLQAGVPWATVPPTTLKRYATGNGGASKDAVLVAAVKRSGGIEFADNNQADAWWLRAMALDFYGEPLAAMPQSHRAALKAVAWPLIGEVASA